MGRFDDTNVIVTRGSSGIGRATVLVRSRADVARLVELAAARGPIGVLVNCAGIAAAEPFLETSDETWRDTLETNLTGAFYASQEAGRRMVETGGGAIVNVASIDSFIAEAPFAAYSASKAGLVMLTRCIAFELGHLGVRCNGVCPGHTDTPMTRPDWTPEFFHTYMRRIPMRRPSRPEGQASVIVFLATGGVITGARTRVAHGWGHTGGVRSCSATARRSSQRASSRTAGGLPPRGAETRASTPRYGGPSTRCGARSDPAS